MGEGSLRKLRFENSSLDLLIWFIIDGFYISEVSISFLPPPISHSFLLSLSYLLLSHHLVQVDKVFLVLMTKD